MELSIVSELTNKKLAAKVRWPEGTEFYTFYRVELADEANGGGAADTSFNPSELEA